MLFLSIVKAKTIAINHVFCFLSPSWFICLMHGRLATNSKNFFGSELGRIGFATVIQWVQIIYRSSYTLRRSRGSPGRSLWAVGYRSWGGRWMRPVFMFACCHYSEAGLFQDKFIIQVFFLHWWCHYVICEEILNVGTINICSAYKTGVINTLISSSRSSHQTLFPSKHLFYKHLRLTHKCMHENILVRLLNLRNNFSREESLLFRQFRLYCYLHVRWGNAFWIVMFYSQ